MAITTIRSNSQPAGGMTATQPVVPQGGLTPGDIQAIVESLTPIQARFRQQSTFLQVTLDQASFTALGQQKNTKISNVGLGIRTITEWNAVITVANSSTAAEVFSFSPLFPYNLVSNTQVQINGGATVYSAGGIATLANMTRQRRGAKRMNMIGAFSGTGIFGPSLDWSLLRMSVGSSLTVTNATGPQLNGVTSISVAGSASTNNTISVTWYTVEKLALDRDSLLGALPLQNNSTFAQISRTIVSALSGTRNDLGMPFFTAGAELTFTLTSCTADTTYEFASVPDDPSTYMSMIQNSYQVQEQTGNTVSSTGTNALVYNIPQNLFLVSATIIGVNGSGVVLQGYGAINGPGASITNGLGYLRVQYNGGSVIPVVQYAGRERAIQYLAYDWDPQNIPGTRIWDGEDTTDDITASDNMGWLDTYSTATPQITADVGASTTTVLNYNLLRESVVAGAVQQIGG